MIKIISKKEYKQLKIAATEWEEQNATIDRLTAACVKLTRRIKELEEKENVRKVTEDTKRTKSTKKSKK